MLSRTLGVVATVAMGANALLLPFGANIENDSLFIAASDPKSQIVRMPCSSCVFSAKAQNAVSTLSDDETFHAQGSAIDVVFNVTISPDNQLLINGDIVDDWNRPQNVFQVPRSATAQEIATMDTRMEILRITGIVATSHSDKVMTQYKYAITALDGHSVYLDDLTIKLLTLDDGELMIFNADHTPSSDEQRFFSEIFSNEAKNKVHDAITPAPPAAPSSDCAHAGPFHKVFCEIKSHITAFRTSHFRGAKKPGCKGGLFRGGAHHPAGKPGVVIGAVPGHLKHHGFGRPHHLPHQPHHPAGPTFGDHMRSALFILGVWFASFFVGLISARIIIAVTTCVRRVFFGAAAPVSSGTKEEGRALMADDDEEAPPVYEDVPVYEEKVVVEEEKKAEAKTEEEDAGPVCGFQIHD